MYHQHFLLPEATIAGYQALKKHSREGASVAGDRLLYIGLSRDFKCSSSGMRMRSAFQRVLTLRRNWTWP